VAHVKNSTIQPIEANARLIAAAPDLLAALEYAAAELESMNKTLGWKDGEWPSVTQARAAIAKAKDQP
jgi:hypothetical protein